ncbi:MAG: signal peptidase II [Pseudomonadales bacterium]|nr:signal peptidase II [Pseudomonadales bacterium]
MNPKAKRHPSQLIWLGLTLLVVLLDQVSKYLADEHLSYAQAVALLPIFDLTLVYNRGAAFSFLADAGGWQRWFFAILAAGVSLVLVVWLQRLKSSETLLAIALAMILGGALGNLYDRVALGYVIDFISVHYKEYYFPAFNFADSAISIGAVLLIIDSLFHRKTKGDICG